MNPEPPTAFEKQLLALEFRHPPATWKALLLPPLPIPWFPKPLLACLAVVWATTITLIWITPAEESLGPPLPYPPPSLNPEEFLLVHNS